MVIFFAVAGNSYLVIRSLIVFFLAEVGLPNNTVSPMSAALITKCLRFFVLFSAVHSSHERLEILVL